VDAEAMKIGATQAQYYKENISENQAGENAAQDQLAYAQAATTAQTLMKAAKMRQDAKMMAEQAKMLNGMAGSISGGGFAFNPNPLNPGDPGYDPNDPNNIPGQVVDAGTDEQGIDPGADPFNPNLDGDGVEGPPPGAFVQGGPNDKGGPGGGGIGAPGATSKAQDDSKADGSSPGKAQTGGQYAAGEGGVGSRFARAGAGGASDSLADFFKKFLPGAGDDVAKEKGREDYTDRSIASDQPSVLGRNKNIFEEISKKYQKKGAEGAIVFSGDKS
jgi:hypothetical protein